MYYTLILFVHQRPQPLLLNLYPIYIYIYYVYMILIYIYILCIHDTYISHYICITYKIFSFTSARSFWSSVYRYTYIYTHARTHTHTHVIWYIRTHARARAHTHTHTHVVHIIWVRLQVRHLRLHLLISLARIICDTCSHPNDMRRVLISHARSLSLRYAGPVY